MTPSKVPSRLVAETQTYSLPGDSTLLIRPTTTNDILAVSFAHPADNHERYSGGVVCSADGFTRGA